MNKNTYRSTVLPSSRQANELLSELELQVSKRCAKATNVVNIIKRGDIILNWLNSPATYDKVLTPDAVIGLGTIIFNVINEWIIKHSRPILHDGMEVTFTIRERDTDNPLFGVGNSKYFIKCGNVTALSLYELIGRTIDERIANNAESYHSSFANSRMDSVLLDAIEDQCIVALSEYEFLKDMGIDVRDRYTFKSILERYAEMESSMSESGWRASQAAITGILANAIFDFYAIGLQLYGIKEDAFKDMIFEDDTVLSDFVFDPENHPTLPTIKLRWVTSFDGALQFDFNPAIYGAQSGRKNNKVNVFDEQCRIVIYQLMNKIFTAWEV